MSRTCHICEEILVDSSQPYCSSKCELLDYLNEQKDTFVHKEEILIVIDK
ncbi:MAG: hypothetical protein GTN35_03985 [Nitrososphaeria archaeon]|nr:hypothetical protein [Nitrosopumilaceae archaeon]NIP10180.1 hypothetical protein [Nitrosopumilaceae archaeon]NIP91543.1 hypothetical protein [Nitrososphaeria archaeon]NIS95378.1 hypothetical protein [Nitrosopumilaceae archaeon]